MIRFLVGKVDELGLTTVLTIEGDNHRIAETVVENTQAKAANVLAMDSLQSATAEDAAGLQETYGYMIAPALEDAGRLDLLQITPDSPCQSAEKLAAYARLFA